jgi:hypothetical protein
MAAVLAGHLQQQPPGTGASSSYLRPRARLAPRHHSETAMRTSRIAGLPGMAMLSPVRWKPHAL